MRKTLQAMFVAILTLPAAPLLASEWNFEVYLNDKKVGTHLFEIKDASDQRRVLSTANFKVKFLFFNAYRYEHIATESWNDNCLARFDARTNVNGDPIEVSGASAETGFVVDKSDSQGLLPACVMTFAYWNPEFLKQERLLNPQNGEYLDVDVQLMGTDTLEVRGEAVKTQRYKITAKGIDLLVWYANDSEWVALESVAESGHIIRYKLS